MLQSVSVLGDGEDKTRTLQNALKLYKQVAHQLNLMSVCSQFEEGMYCNWWVLYSNLTKEILNFSSILRRNS